ncbi:MAG: DMT family transporter [Elusimicrobiales bacterium]|nr:DMT family transporter [Elusimicrobiales bacterium]
MNYMLLLFTVTVWGVSFTFTKTLAGELSPATIVALRCVGGMATLFFITGNMGWVKRLSPREWFRMAVSAVTGVVLVQFFQAWALSHTTANHAGWLVGTMPMIVAVMMVALFGEYIGKLRTLGFLLGFAGVLSVVLSRQRGAGGAVLPTGLGDGIFIISAFSWASYVIQVSRWFRHLPQTGVAFLHMTIAFLIIAPVSLLQGGFGEVLRLSGHGWLAAAYLGILSSGLGYYFWNAGVERLGASSAAAFLYIEPLAAQVAAVLILNEIISPAAALGGVVIMCGVYWVNGGRAGADTLKKIYCLVAQ